MSRGDRLGIAGLILALIGIGIAVLWPTVRWIGWLAIIAAIVLCVRWALLEFERPKESPSFVFVFGAPLGDNQSPTWIMMLKHYGPNPAYNCDIEFFDRDRKNIEHEWLVRHPNSPFPPPGLVGKSQERVRVAEAGPQGSIGGFQWSPLDPDRQHYEVVINCRGGVFVEQWDVTRVCGLLKAKIVIRHGPQWIAKNPRLDPVVFACADPEFIDTPLASVPPAITRNAVHPCWKPNHVFQVPAAIIDPNGHVQVMSGVKQPDGTTRTDFGCWNILTEHRGDTPAKRSRALRFLQRFASERTK